MLCIKPVALEVEEDEDEDGKEKGAIYAWPLEEVGCREEEEEVKWRGIRSGLWSALSSKRNSFARTYRKNKGRSQIRRQNMLLVAPVESSVQAGDSRVRVP